ncbi:MAG: D-alanyl-D-alanine carboxypeptidase [Spirochaetales bacterium]|jgi:D-alanyl-D-alanine carboxypeptidase (penicillin-binding protein 5/6)|nr:D-alanyl-D-alanine carboxypeptidase [Spirochaetales bacterium]
MRITPAKPLSAFLLLLVLCFPLKAQDEAPRISARAAALIDAKTGELIYEKNSKSPHPPASLAKVVTIYVLLEKIAGGELSLTQEIIPPEKSWAVNLPRDSSLMFLGPGQKLTTLDLLKGLAVSSGNDAAVAAGILCAGSPTAFAGLMNAVCEKENISGLHFVEPSGYDEHNTITAGGFADFLRIYISRHPQALEKLHSLPEFTYPRSENITGGANPPPITQKNRNSLLFSYAGVDGIKTGYLNESGYNIALTAQRGGMRLILVLLGEEGASPAEAMNTRNKDAAALFDYGFDNFTTFAMAPPPVEAVRVWKGEEQEIIPLSPREIWITAPKNAAKNLRGEINQKKFVTAPVAEGEILGKIRVMLGAKPVYEENLTSPRKIERGSFFRAAWDSVVIFFRDLFGFPVD